MKKIKTERLLLTEDLLAIGHGFDQENLEELILFLHDQQDKFTRRGFYNIRLNFDWGGYDSPYQLVIRGDRLEPDEVYYERLSREKESLEKEILRKRKAEEKRLEKMKKQEEVELKLLEELKKKYEK